MKFLYLTLICILNFPLNAILPPRLSYQSMRELVLKAEQTTLEASFHVYAYHIIDERSDSNARSKAIRNLFRIAVDRGHRTSIAFLLPHVPFGVAKEYDQLQQRLKTEKLSDSHRLMYREISTILLKDRILQFAKKQNSFLHTLPGELLDFILKYHESEYCTAKPHKPESIYKLMMKRDRQNKIDSKSFYRSIDGTYY